MSDNKSPALYSSVLFRRIPVSLSKQNFANRDMWPNSTEVSLLATIVPRMNGNPKSG